MEVESPKETQEPSKLFLFRTSFFLFRRVLDLLVEGLEGPRGAITSSSRNTGGSPGRSKSRGQKQWKGAKDLVLMDVNGVYNAMFGVKVWIMRETICTITRMPLALQEALPPESKDSKVTKVPCSM